MNAKLSEISKFDIGLVPQTLNNSNATGAYYPMRDFRRALARLDAGAMAVSKSTKIELLQAQDAAGTGAKPLVPAVESTISANASVVELTIALATVLAAEAVTINGVTFTAHATVTSPASREFKIDGNDTADAAALAGLINNSTYGVAGVTASASSGTITLKSTRPGETLFSASSAASTFTIATTKHETLIECSHFDLDHENGFDWVACKVTTTGNTPVSATLARYEPREAISLG